LKSLGNPQVFAEKLSGVLIEVRRQGALPQWLREFPQAPSKLVASMTVIGDVMPPTGGTLIASC